MLQSDTHPKSTSFIFFIVHETDSKDSNFPFSFFGDENVPQLDIWIVKLKSSGLFYYYFQSLRGNFCWTFLTQNYLMQLKKTN